MDNVPPKSPRGDRRDGLLHRANACLRRPLLLFVIDHDRRRIPHFNATKYPTSAWVSQQVRETFPYDSAPKHLLFDRSVSFSQEVIETIKSFGIEPKRTSFQSPWQNGVVERFLGTCRRDLLDHVIVLNERHLKRLMTEYISYYHEDRTHLGLEKQTPVGRKAAMKIPVNANVVSRHMISGGPARGSAMIPGARELEQIQFLLT